MKVSILYSHLTELGGAENVILTELKLLRRNDHQVKCYFSYVDEHLTQKSENPHHFIETYLSLPIQSELVNILLSVPFAPFSANMFKGSDVLICHGCGPAVWMGFISKKINGTKYLSYIHSPPRFLYLSTQQRKLWRFNRTRTFIYAFNNMCWPLFKTLDYQSVTNSDGILANSIFTARRVKAIYGVRPKVCYPSIDTNTFRPQEETKTKEIRSKFGWPLILSTGRIVAIKRWEWLIKTMSYIIKTYPHVTLAITGKISKENMKYIQQLVQTAKSLGVHKNVKWLGFQSTDDLVKLYNAADVYAYSAPLEDFGLGPVEAMSCGTPAVVWNDGAGPCETVIDGKTGFKADPYDLGDFAEKVMKTIDLDKRTLRDFAPGYVNQNFSSQKHLEILEGELKKL